MNNSPQLYYSNIVTNSFPRKLALIYRRFYEEACKDDKRQAITELNTLVEQTLKFLVIYLSAEKLASKDGSARESQIHFRNYLLSKPSIGKSIEYLKSLKANSETEPLYKSFLHAPRSQFLQAVGSFNTDCTERHGGSFDEESALALFKKHAESITKAVEKLRLFKEFPLMGTTSDGREISLCGVSSVPAKLRDDSATLYDNGSSYLSIWPFVLIDSSSHTVALNLNDIWNTEDANKRAIYIGALTKEKRELVTSDEDKLAIRIFAALKDKLGLLVEGPRRAVLDSFADYDEKIRDFSGRRWLFDDIKTFIETPGQSLFLIVGQPGVGKSAFMKRFPDLAEQYDPRGQLLSVSSQFFITYNNTTRNTVVACLQHIVQELQQAATVKLRLDRDNKPRTEPQESVYRLQLLLDQIRNADPNYYDLPIPIFIDGVDELKPGEINPFVEAVNSLRTIPNIKLVITSRDIAELQNLHKPDQRLQLEKDARHRADLSYYAQTELAGRGWEDRFVEELIEKTVGIFLYLVMVIRDVQLGQMMKEDLGSLPSGLEAFYQATLKTRLSARFEHRRIGWETFGFKILKLICIAERPFTRAQLANFCSREIAQVRQALDIMQELLTCDAEDDSYRFFHLSLQEYISSHFPDELREAHATIVDYYRRVLPDNKGTLLDDYFHRYIHEHIKAAGAFEVFEEFVRNPDFHQQRVAWFVTPCENPEIDPESGYGYWLANRSRNDHFDLFYSGYLKMLPMRPTKDLRQFLLRVVQYYPVLHAHSIIPDLPSDVADHYVGMAGAQTMHLLPLLAARDPHFLYTYAVSVRSLWLGALAKLTLVDFDYPQYQPSDNDLAILRQYLRDDRDWGGEWIQGERPPSECQRTLFLYLTGLSDKAIKLLFPDSDSENNDDVLLLSKRDHDRYARYPRSISEYRRCVEKAFAGSVSVDLEYLHNCDPEDIKLYSAYRSLIQTLVQGLKEEAVEWLSRVADCKPRGIYLALVEEFLPELRNELSGPKSLSDLLEAYRDYLNNELDSIPPEVLCFGDNVAGLEVLIFFERVLEFLLDNVPDQLLACLISALQPRLKEFSPLPDGGSRRQFPPGLALLDSTFIYRRLLRCNDAKYDEFRDAALEAWQWGIYGRRMAGEEFARREKEFQEIWAESNSPSSQPLEIDGVAIFGFQEPRPFPLKVKYGARMCLERLSATESKFEDELFGITAPENREMAYRILTDPTVLTPVSQDLSNKLSEILKRAFYYSFKTDQLINKMLEVIKKNIPSPQ